MELIFVLGSAVGGLFFGGIVIYYIASQKRSHQEALHHQQQEMLHQQIARTESELRESKEHLVVIEQQKQEIQEKHQQLSQHHSALKAQFDSLSSQFDSLKDQSMEQDSTIRRMIQTNTAQEETIQHLQERLSEEQKLAQEKLQILEESKEKLKLEFQNLANKIFDEKHSKFSIQSQENLNLILKPFREQIGEFKKKVEDSYSSEAKERHSLVREIEKLKELNLKMSQDAINLTHALKGESKTRGNWGEMVLERILEESGLRKGIEYDVQETLRDEEGSMKKPDVIVRLPENKDVIIDSKLSLNAYESYSSCDDPDLQKSYLASHLQSIKTHIKELTAKDYEKLEGVRTLDFILMFMPIESAFLVAAQEDRQLFVDALEKNIVIVSPSTLLVTLRTIQNIWRYEYQNKNAQEIAKKAGDLYDKFTGFVEDMEKIGTQIERLQDTHNNAYKKLATGKGNLINRANAMIELGVKSKKLLEDRGEE